MKKIIKFLILFMIFSIILYFGLVFTYAYSDVNKINELIKCVFCFLMIFLCYVLSDMLDE